MSTADSRSRSLVAGDVVAGCSRPPRSCSRRSRWGRASARDRRPPGTHGSRRCAARDRRGSDERTLPVDGAQGARCSRASPCRRHDRRRHHRRAAPLSRGYDTEEPMASSLELNGVNAAYVGVAPPGLPRGAEQRPARVARALRDRPARRCGRASGAGSACGRRPDSPPSGERRRAARRARGADRGRAAGAGRPAAPRRRRPDAPEVEAAAPRAATACTCHRSTAGAPRPPARRSRCRRTADRLEPPSLPGLAGRRVRARRGRRRDGARQGDPHARPPRGAARSARLGADGRSRARRDAPRSRR